MSSFRLPRGRVREFAVVGAGLAASAALLLAGATVQSGLRTAGEVAVARLSGVVEDTLLAEWGRLRRSGEDPVSPAGERFRWRAGAAPPEPFVLRERWSVPHGLSVAATLLAEAERLELVERDAAGALALAQEALEKEPDSPLRAEGWLRVVQLALRLDRPELAAVHAASLGALDLAEARAGIPYSLLAWLALCEHGTGAEAAPRATEAELVGLLAEEDRLVLGPAELPEARLELAPLLQALEERGFVLGAAVRMQRRVQALARLTGLPPVPEDDAWHWRTLAERAFCARRNGAETHGFFASPAVLRETLERRSSVPAGFALDFRGDDATLGAAVRPPVQLAGSDLAFTLRHADPARLGRDESARLRLLRAALLVLAIACAGGGLLTARLLARQRKLDELKSAFIAGVSHDLRTPLASILLLAENLESGVVPETERGRYHRALRREATRLRRLIDDVLDFSRLERGETPRLEREELDLAGFVDGLEADLGARVAEEGRAFAVERTDLPASAVLDGHAVRRALENLVENALKHGAGTVRLVFTAAAGRLSIRVSDEGPGVPAADRERIFQPFERRDGLAGSAGGTGLGLAIVRSIARAHGGEARVCDDPLAGGAVFGLELPLEEPTLVEDKA